MGAFQFHQSLIRHAIYEKDYRSQQRQEWYSSVAEAYYRARPRYLEAMIDRVLDEAYLQDAQSMSRSLLEIGCGPGIATKALAARGFKVTAIDPSQAACEVARCHCQATDQVTIIHSTFEDFRLNSRLEHSYDAVVAATSFHWLSPEIACQKSAVALKPGGALILLWATPPQLSLEVYQTLRPLYERYGLTELGQEQCRSRDYYYDSFATFADMIEQSGYFEASSVKIEAHRSLYSIEKYLALLSTLSGYIGLEAKQRAQLLADLGQALATHFDVPLLTQPEGPVLETTHWFASQVALLKS